MSKKNTLMAVDPEFKKFFKKLSADRGITMIDLSRDLSKDQEKIFRVMGKEKPEDKKSKKKVGGVNYGFF